MSTNRTREASAAADTDDDNAMKGALVAALATVLIVVVAVGAVMSDSLGTVGGLAIFAAVFGIAVMAGLIVGRDPD